MIEYDIIESFVWVECPLYHCLKKVYTYSIPNNHLYFCNGCDDLHNSKHCKQCTSLVTSLMINGKITPTTDILSELISPVPLPEPIGTLSNPIRLK